jgi:hypothetical protein
MSNLPIEDQIVQFYIYYAKYVKLTSMDFTKRLYNTDNKAFLDRDRAMFHLMNEIVERGQRTGELIRTEESIAIVEYFFITARGIVFDWCLHDGSYDIEEVLPFYMRRLVTVFKQQ